MFCCWKERCKLEDLQWSAWNRLRRGALTILIPCHVASESANTPARELSL